MVGSRVRRGVPSTLPHRGYSIAPTPEFPAVKTPASGCLVAWPGLSTECPPMVQKDSCELTSHPFKTARLYRLGASTGAWSLNSKPEQCLVGEFPTRGGLAKEDFSFILSQDRLWGLPVPEV